MLGTVVVPPCVKARRHWEDGVLSRRTDYPTSALIVGKGLERCHFTIRGDSLSLFLSVQTGFL